MSVADFLNDFNKDAFSLNKHPLTGLKFEDRENSSLTVGGNGCLPVKAPGLVGF
ncbi:hypothetical protein MASR1M12_18610 [Erysipelotrichia bacterium]